MFLTRSRLKFFAPLVTLCSFFQIASFVFLASPANAVFNVCCVCRPPPGTTDCSFKTFESGFDCSQVGAGSVVGPPAGYHGRCLNITTAARMRSGNGVTCPAVTGVRDWVQNSCDTYEYEEGTNSVNPPISTQSGGLDEGVANFHSIEPVLSVPIPGVSFSPATLDNGEVTVPFLAQYILGVYRFAIGAAAILASIMVVYGGFRYLLGSTLGDVKEGKTVIQNAVIGLIVLLCSYVILRSVNPDLVTLRALKLTYQERILDAEAEHVDNGAGGTGSGASTSGGSGSGGPSGYTIPDNTSAFTRPTSLALVSAPDTDCMHLVYGQVNAQLVEPLRRAGEIFCRLRASVPSGGAWRINAGDTSRSMTNQLDTWLSNHCDTNPHCTATCSPFAHGYTPVAGTPVAELRQHLGDPLQCPHTSGVGVDLFCDGTPGQRASGPWRYPYVPCQLLLERAMIEAGFCRLRQETWHFELNAIRMSGRNCNNNASEIVGKVQAERTESAYDYSACTASWSFRDRAHESCSRAIAPTTTGGSEVASGASIPPPRRGLPEASGGITGSQFALQLLGITDATIGARVLDEAKNGHLDAAYALIPSGSRPLSDAARENAIVETITRQHYPAFLSQFIGINVSSGRHSGTFFVAPDMLSVGTNADYLRVPMTARAAQRIATNFGLLLPTKKMVDAMLHASNVRKEVMEGQGPYRGSRDHTFLYIKTNKLIQDQRNAHFDSSLHTAYIGGKKNVVIAPQMSQRSPGEGHACPYLHVWIYGALASASSATVTQTLASPHDEAYFDYSHGINLIGAEMIVDGNRKTVSEVLADRELAPLISDAPILDPRYPLEGAIEVCS